MAIPPRIILSIRSLYGVPLSTIAEATNTAPQTTALIIINDAALFFFIPGFLIRMQYKKFFSLSGAQFLKHEIRKINKPVFLFLTCLLYHYQEGCMMTTH